MARKRELIALGGGVITDLVLAIDGNETGGGVGLDGFGYKLSFIFISLYVVVRTRGEGFFLVLPLGSELTNVELSAL